MMIQRMKLVATTAVFAAFALAATVVAMQTDLLAGNGVRAHDETLECDGRD